MVEDSHPNDGTSWHVQQFYTYGRDGWTPEVFDTHSLARARFDAIAAREPQPVDFAKVTLTRVYRTHVAEFGPSTLNPKT